MKAARTLAAMVLVCTATAACCADVCRPATEWVPRICPIKLPQVRSVAVTPDAQDAGAQAQPWADCSRFRLTPSLVRRYLSRAWLVDDPRGESAVDRGPCSAEGTVTWTDGRVAHWRIEQIGTATLSMGNGEQVLTLLCLRCGFPPFRR